MKRIIYSLFGRWLRERDRARQLRDAARSRYCDINLACVWRGPLHEPEKHENECFICSRRGRDYDIDKKPKR